MRPLRAASATVRTARARPSDAAAPASRPRRALFPILAALLGWRSARPRRRPTFAIRDGWILRGDDR
jgi:hypothetical protein